MIKRFCDSCGTQIASPHVLGKSLTILNSVNKKFDVTITMTPVKDKNPAGPELCQSCVDLLLAKLKLAL